MTMNNFPHPRVLSQLGAIVSISKEPFISTFSDWQKHIEGSTLTVHTPQHHLRPLYHGQLRAKRRCDVSFPKSPMRAGREPRRMQSVKVAIFAPKNIRIGEKGTLHTTLYTPALCFSHPTSPNHLVFSNSTCLIPPSQDLIKSINTSARANSRFPAVEPRNSNHTNTLGTTARPHNQTIFQDDT